MPTFDHGLEFRDLEDAVAYAQRCLKDGYEQTGNWDLAQTCRHLSDWMKATMDGTPHVPLLMGLILAIVSRTVGPAMLRKVLAERKMKSGLGTVAATVHPPETNAAAAVEDFASTAARLNVHAGPWQWSPVFRTADRKQSIDLQLVHCMHHLGRLKPRSA